MALLARFASRNNSSIVKNAVRSFHASSRRDHKVCVVGAAGGIGQPLSLLLKNNSLVTELTLYDLAPITPGVAADLSHINTPAKVTGYCGDAKELEKALEGCDVVVVPAGVPRKPGMTRDDLFNINAGIVAGIATAASKQCPNAALCIISNPVNSTVPIIADTLKKLGTYNPNKLFGVTTLDVVRANTFVAADQGMDVNKVNVPVIGGHAGTTIVPLLSQAEPTATFADAERDALTHRIMFGGDEVVKAKDGAGSATLSMALAGAEFADRVMAGLAGEKGVTECTFVETDKVDGCTFFSLPVTLGTDGVDTIHDYGTVNAYETKLIQDMLPDLIAQAKKGVAWANEKK
jgi:malate dehydrogenase